MKRLLMLSIATLATVGLFAADAAARARTRVTVTARPPYAPEPSTIYGYAPGNYVLGRNGMLYGPYPRKPVVLVFPYGPYDYGPAWDRPWLR
jgi:hypothetical protein